MKRIDDEVRSLEANLRQATITRDRAATAVVELQGALRVLYKLREELPVGKQAEAPTKPRKAKGD